MSFWAFARANYGWYLGIMAGAGGGVGVTWAYAEHQIAGGWMCIGPFLVIGGGIIGATAQRLCEARRS